MTAMQIQVIKKEKILLNQNLSIWSPQMLKLFMLLVLKIYSQIPS